MGSEMCIRDRLCGVANLSMRFELNGAPLSDSRRLGVPESWQAGLSLLIFYEVEDTFYSWISCLLIDNREF